MLDRIMFTALQLPYWKSFTRLNLSAFFIYSQYKS